jgi:hypothetical protein
MAKEKADIDKRGWFARWRSSTSVSKDVPMSPTDKLVVAEVAGSQPEAEMLCSLLRSAGIACMPRLTSRGAGAGDGFGIGGEHEITVRSKDAQAARKILRRPG